MHGDPDSRTLAQRGRGIHSLNTQSLYVCQTFMNNILNRLKRKILLHGLFRQKT